MYKISFENQSHILKKSNDYEIEVYENILRDKGQPVPEYLGSITEGKQQWILLQYIAGEDLRKFNEEMVVGCADSLAQIFNLYWQEDEFAEKKLDNRFERYWTRINKRAKCLKNEEKLAEAYQIFLDRQLECPRTLCNGDFLQFNAINNNGRIILIDWAFAGIMPYSLDLARLITHGSERYFPFPFYMTDEYRKIFIKGVYERLAYKPDYKQYVWDIILSCLNECIEFIESELKDITRERDEVFNYYYEKADKLATIILQGKENNSIFNNIEEEFKYGNR